MPLTLLCHISDCPALPDSFSLPLSPGFLHLGCTGAFFFFKKSTEIKITMEKPETVPTTLDWLHTGTYSPSSSKCSKEFKRSARLHPHLFFSAKHPLAFWILPLKILSGRQREPFPHSTLKLCRYNNISLSWIWGPQFAGFYCKFTAGLGWSSWKSMLFLTLLTPRKLQPAHLIGVKMRSQMEWLPVLLPTHGSVLQTLFFCFTCMHILFKDLQRWDKS